MESAHHCMTTYYTMVLQCIALMLHKSQANTDLYYVWYYTGDKGKHYTCKLLPRRSQHVILPLQLQVIIDSIQWRKSFLCLYIYNLFVYCLCRPYSAVFICPGHRIWYFILHLAPNVLRCQCSVGQLPKQNLLMTNQTTSAVIDIFLLY